MSERVFRGIWIPREIWLDKNLTLLEKAVFAEVDSLGMRPDGCFAKNEHFAEMFGCSERKVSAAISKLEKIGYVKTVKFDGRNRWLESCMRVVLGSDTTDATVPGCITKFSMQHHEICDAGSRDVPPSYIYNTSLLENTYKSDSKSVSDENYIADASQKHKKFVPPTVEEIRNYVTENHYSIDPETFFDYYEVRGWMAGKTPMKDWKAAVRLWQRKQKPTVSTTPPSPPPKVVPKPVQAPTPPAKDEEPKNVRRQVTLKDDDNRLVGLLYEDGEIVVIRKEGRFTHADVGPFGMKRINISGYRSVKRWEDATCDPDTQLSDFFP